MKLKFDSNSIDNKVIPSLRKTKRCLSKAAYSNYVIPGDCAYLNYLETLSSRIRKLEEKTKVLEIGLKDKIRNSNTITDNSLDEISKIQIIKIEKK